MATTEDITKFSKAAWIAPDGELILCSNWYAHVPELRDRYEWIDNLISEATERDIRSSDEFVAEYAEDEHIPWHCYDDSDYRSTAIAEIISTLYSENWVRLAIYEGVMGVDGLKSGYEKHKKLIEDIAIFKNCKVEFKNAKIK